MISRTRRRNAKQDKRKTGVREENLARALVHAGDAWFEGKKFKTPAPTLERIKRRLKD